MEARITEKSASATTNAHQAMNSQPPSTECRTIPPQLAIPHAVTRQQHANHRRVGFLAGIIGIIFPEHQKESLGGTTTVGFMELPSSGKEVEPALAQRGWTQVPLWND